MAFKKRNKASAAFNMSALTDIIFLLLIFFMLTSGSTSSNILRLQLPQSGSTTPSPQTFALSITKHAQYFIEDKQVDYPYLEEKLLLRINEERAKIAKEKIDEKELTIVLNVESEVTTGTIVDAMKIANKLGVRMILGTDARNRPEY